MENKTEIMAQIVALLSQLIENDNNTNKENVITHSSEPVEMLTITECTRAVMFKEACMHGYKASAVKFEELSEEWFEEYAKPNLRSTTYERMLQLRHRVYRYWCFGRNKAQL